MDLKYFKYFFTIILMTFVRSNQSANSDSFPENFLFGVASSAYQVEGAWNESGKGESNWDYLVHNYPNEIKDRSTGDFSSNSFHKYKEDIQLIKNLGVDYYRFSISWSRILPFGYSNRINKKGVEHYHKILDELERHNITPFVTIYHWDHPQNLDDEFGGWLSVKMAYTYANYARIIFKEFGNRIPFFITVNEPYIYCTQNLQKFHLLNGRNLTGWGKYHCLHNMLKGHALAYHIYDKEFRKKQKGKIGIVNPCLDYYLKDEENSELKDFAFEFQCGWTANPIFSKKGDYPEVMKKRIAERSRRQGYKYSRLPTFTRYWINYIRGSYDYFGLNHYTSERIEPLSDDEILNWPDDDGFIHDSDPSWETAQSNWLKIVPEGLGNLLRIVKDKYDNPPVYILENGVSDGNGTSDNMRINYIYSYAKEVLTAMRRDGCDVRSYTYWSLLDSFEWESGYTARFGLYQVDFKDENRTRTPKKSVEWFKKVVKSRRLFST